MPELPRPLNWNLLTSPEAEQEWEELNDWVNWLRHIYGLPVSVIPPYWHRQPGGQRDRSLASPALCRAWPRRVAWELPAGTRSGYDDKLGLCKSATYLQQILGQRRHSGSKLA